MKFKGILSNQGGLALVVSLMLLVLLTVMGLAAISTTTTEIQLAGNERTDTQALQSAEAGIREVLYRSTLAGLGATPIVNGGSWATVDGFQFDAAITDPAPWAGPTPSLPDPNWQYNVYFGAAPASGSNSVSNVASILPAADQAGLDYSSVGNVAGDNPVTVRYLRESDLCFWGINPCDLFDGDGDGVPEGDGDTLDLVYYNGDEANPQRLGAGVATNGTIDWQPPPGINQNLVIMLVTSIGRSGNASKTIQLETTGFPVNPAASSALQTDVPITLTGNGYISGYNHSADTTKSDETNYDPTLHENNGCDNYSKSGGDGNCQAAYQGAGNDPDDGYDAEYSSKAQGNAGHKPALLASAEPTTQGNFEGWGGSDDNTEGWKKIDPSVIFPDLATLLGVDQQVVDDMLLGANTDPTSCPTGVTYIDNKDSAQIYTPGKNCPAGSGILIVTGDIKAASQFEFRGLVYVEGDAELRGGAWFLGALAVKGTADTKLGAGGATVLYSKDTVDNAVTAAMNQLGFAFTTLSWREF